MQTKPFSAQQIEKFRADTPGTTNVTHLNNAGSSLPVISTVNAVTEYLKEEALIGGYEAEAKYGTQLNDTYALIGKLINANDEEIALVENASTGWCIAFHGIDFKAGDEVIISELEYVTNMIGFLNAQKLYGIELIVVPNDAQGNFSLEGLEQAITAQTKLIAVTHVGSSTGGVLPVEEIGRIAAKHQILYLLDACQSIGQMPVDVRAIGCDFLSVTGRKYLRAPRGTGFMYVKRAVQDRLKTLFVDGHSIEWINEQGYQPRNDAKRFELYEKSRALTLGLNNAVAYALDAGIDNIWQRISYLAGHLRSNLQAIEGVSVQDIGDQLCGIVTFSLTNVESQLIKDRLAEHQINVSVGLPKSTLLFMNKHQLNNVLRASVHYYNTEAELDALCKVVRALAVKS